MNGRVDASAVRQGRGRLRPRRGAAVPGASLPSRLCSLSYGRGYWMVTRVGAVPSFGSAAAVGPASPLLDVAGIFANPGGPGYWPMGRDGGSSPTAAGALPGVGTGHGHRRRHLDGTAGLAGFGRPRSTVEPPPASPRSSLRSAHADTPGDT